MIDVIETLLSEDQQFIQRVPQHYQHYAQSFPQVLVMLGQALAAESLPQQYQPQLIEIYLNGSTEPALILDQGRVVYCDLSLFGA